MPSEKFYQFLMTNSVYGFPKKRRVYDCHVFASCNVADVRAHLDFHPPITCPELLRISDNELDKFLELCSRKYVIHDADYGIDINEIERLLKDYKNGNT